MRDFTIKVYGKLLVALKDQGYYFFAFEKFIETSKVRAITLRHDVDRKPKNSLIIARLEKSAGISSSYYFRAVPESYDENIIREIADMGHEVGYHYETMDTCRGDIDKAYDEFCHNLEMFRKIIPIGTICMHGSPLSKWDNLDIWKKYDYKKLHIKAEPFLDLNFEEVFYLTDTGRRWDGDKVNVRDRVGGRRSEVGGREKDDAFGGMNGGVDEGKYGSRESGVRSQGAEEHWPRFHSTFNIIEAVEVGRFPDKVMMTVHPQRWTDDPVAWTKELVLQNVKNVGKRVLVRRKELLSS